VFGAEQAVFYWGGSAGSLGRRGPIAAVCLAADILRPSEHVIARKGGRGGAPPPSPSLQGCSICRVRGLSAFAVDQDRTGAGTGFDGFMGFDRV